MKKISRKISIVILLTIGIVAFTMFNAKEAYAPHISEKSKVYKKACEEEKAKKGTGTVYVKCPNCGKTIKINIKVSK